MKTLYLVLALIGGIVPTIFRGMFVAKHGLDFKMILQSVLSSYPALFLATGIIITGVTVLVVCWAGVKKGVKHLWLPALGTLLLGPAFGLPMYLYLAEGTGKVSKRKK